MLSYSFENLKEALDPVHQERNNQGNREGRQGHNNYNIVLGTQCLSEKFRFQNYVYYELSFVKNHTYRAETLEEIGHPNYTQKEKIKLAP